MSILLVEGNSHVRDVIASILEIDGYEVVMASSGIEALHTLRRSNIDLALVDITEPTLDGWNLCQTILVSPTVAVPLVVMTGAISAADPPAGVLLRKPFGMNQLLETVRTQMTRARRRKRVRHGAVPTKSCLAVKRRIVG